MILHDLKAKFIKPKLRYGGEIIHSERDEFGLIQVVDSPICRSLHFDSAVKQSRYFFQAPLSLAFEYQQVIEQQLWLKQIEKPIKNLLMLGVGGGSLASKLFISHPKLVMTLVDLRPAVIDIAHDFFHLPLHSQIKTHAMDAEIFIAENSTHYDAIIIDLFDKHGMPEAFSQAPFLNNLHKKLKPGSILLFNLWQSTPEPTLKVIQFFEALTHQKQGELQLYPIKSSNNLILEYTSLTN
ncbi:fused MFS/spermidine synthase [Thiomicrospira microaerophila]|uniref:spermidine synthase n=1 Tax=Thiomicrospira microaerophila TaxID=406020 RepID=UPI00200ED7AC|nr:fused MFS/spermidine synthase [Thiomicrospira microaerophila]UQB41503.1 fused MFS/spermidine synthase [Thiomicrospira microaerophila]